MGGPRGLLAAGACLVTFFVTTPLVAAEPPLGRQPVSLERGLELFYGSLPGPDRDTVTWTEGAERSFELRYRRWDGVWVRGLVFLPDAGAPSTVVLCVPRAGGEETALTLARGLRSRGFATVVPLSPDLVAGSLVQGRNRILEGLLQRRDAVVDAVQVLEFALARPDLAAGQVLVVGTEDAAPAAAVLVRLPDALGLALVLTRGSGRLVETEGIQLAEGKEKGLARLLRLVDAGELVASVGSRPLLFLNLKAAGGGADDRARDLHCRAPGARVELVEKGQGVSSAELQVILVSWLREVASTPPREAPALDREG